MPDILDLLRMQHREVEALFERILGRGPKRARERAFDELFNRLVIHLEAEEQVFYPALKTRQTEDQLREMAEEHLSCKRILADLCELSIDDPTWMAKVEVLRHQVIDHIHDEEREAFPMAKRSLDEDHLLALAQELTRVEDDILGLGEGGMRDHITSETDRAAPI